jgi:hypothetical protein
MFLRSCALTVRARVRPFQRQLVQMFRDETSRDSLATFTCASCAESVQLAQRKIENWHDLNLDVLRRPDKEHDEDMSSDCFSSFSSDSPLAHFFLDPALTIVDVWLEGPNQTRDRGLQSAK